MAQSSIVGPMVGWCDVGWCNDAVREVLAIAAARPALSLVREQASVRAGVGPGISAGVTDVAIADTNQAGL